ncbi:MAG: DUF389 domain-containing protein [Myxococcales bacterium]|nr:DUF389 domain-containing protein [Myxococcales bacterium]
MIDLFIAVACALAAVYTTVREGKDAMAAAAGTAIGIALVPPLCTAGYGLGTGNHDMLQGALFALHRQLRGDHRGHRWRRCCCWASARSTPPRSRTTCSSARPRAAGPCRRPGHAPHRRPPPGAR